MAVEGYRTVIRRQSWLLLCLVVAVSVLLLVLSKENSLRSDWSDSQSLSLSPSTIQLLQSLDEPLHIKAYFSADLPQPYAQMQRFIVDKLISYRDAKQGDVSFEVIDPATDADMEASLRRLQVPKVQIQVLEHDRAQVRQVYLAIVLEYLGKQEVIPIVQTDMGFEYLVTSKLKKISGKGKKTIAVATGFGASSLDKLQMLQQLLRHDYDIITVDLANDFVPDTVKVLLVAGTESPPTMLFRYHLDQFRMAGGGVLVLAGNAKSNLDAGFAVLPVQAGGNVWLLDDLGVSVEPGLLVDQQASRVTLNQQQAGSSFRSVVDFPFIANVLDINRHHILVQGLESVLMPFSAPLLWVDPAYNKHVLLTSSPWSAIQDGPPFDIDPLVSMDERFKGLSLHASSLLLLQEGKMVSSFQEMPDFMQHESGFEHQASTHHGRLLVSGSASLLDDTFIEGENTIFLLNVFDWLSGDEVLIDLRSRGVTQRPLEPLDEAGRTFFKVLWVFALPMFLVVLGGWRWLWLRQRRAR